jgi:hypothetical protein
MFRVNVCIEHFPLLSSGVPSIDQDKAALFSASQYEYNYGGKQRQLDKSGKTKNVKLQRR